MAGPKLLNSIEVIKRLEDGELEKVFTKEMRKAAASVKQGSIKAKATITLKLTISKLAFDQLMITGDIETKPTKRVPEVSVLFVLPGGELTCDNPSSLKDLPEKTID